VELNDKELRRLDIQDSMFIGYGYQPVMITANCMKKTTGNCDRKKGFLSIQDRYQKTFQVQACCPYCYNVIYNSTPLYLADQPEIIEQLDPAELRLDFTEETGKQTEKIIKAYAEAVYFQKKIPASKMEYTRGHIKRGVK
jgi:putative protease